ncbi:TetR family transcriptional regulator [Ktedonobacter sp. SOSP1-85]|uniref:TetR/AcrR family transcriptional regulator n=1 Tax=Ktedonobacter sp. SOSP1-85 TaxID=2778367 RepID=UPI00191501CA|nr:TetR/AcrR family transcriptional regulator [Ktedonobacter sp. SOSP1-85]GHO81779.1 TetR family transcriptional regulator [Ktedonobacter sp. SOSP1-85]
MKQEKQDRRSRRTRQLVRSALAELLQEKRYEEITVRDILERANIGSSTFYAHYFDKDDVQASLLKELFEQLLQQLLSRSGKQEVVPSLELFQHVQQNIPQLQGLIRSRSGETLWKVVERTMSQTIEHTLTGATSAPEDKGVPAPLVAHYLATTFLTLLKWWLAEDMPYSVEQMDEFFQQLTLPGRWAPVENKSE